MSRRSVGGASTKTSSSPNEEKKGSLTSSKDLWTQALEHQNSPPAPPSTDPSVPPPTTPPTPRESTVIYVGPRSSGKSTLMQHFMFKDRDETPKPTTSLDYKFTKTSLKDSMSDEKSLSHFWEIGGGRHFISLLEIALSEKSIADALVVVVLDISTPTRIINDALFYLQSVRARCDEIIKISNKSPTPLPDLRGRALKSYGENHPDTGKLDPLPVSMLICINKFDLSASQSPEAFKQVIKTLRYIAHTNGASLTLTSRTQRDQYEKFYRTRIGFHVMNNDSAKKPTPVVDPTLPIAIVVGTDSLANIGDPPSTGTSKTILGQWIFSLSKLYAKNEEEKEVAAYEYYYNSDPIDTNIKDMGMDIDETTATIASLNTFKDVTLSPEQGIDNLLKGKEEDLKRMIRENITKRKVAAVDLKVK